MTEQVEHIRFTAGEVELALEAGAGETGRRIAGLAVPYDVEAEVWPLGRLEFAPGSVELAGRVPMLLGHDTNRPVGVLAEKIDSDSGLYLTFKIDRTGDGDAALEQAASGSRAGLSVGADIVEFEMLEEGELTRVTLAKVTETSLVALAAFDSAAVDAVAAQRHHKGEKMTEESTSTLEAAKTAAAQAERIAELELELKKHDDRPNATDKPVVLAERPPARMRLGEFVQTFVKAEKGDKEAVARIEAALTREVVANEPGVIPIATVADLVDGLGADRPLFESFSRKELPSAGMTLRRPQITTRPDGGWMADDTAGAVSTAVVIGNLDVPVRQWSWGGSASVALVERSSPSYVEEVFQQALKSYYRDVEATIAGNMPSGASTVTTLGGAVAAYLTATRTYPNLLVLGATAMGKVIDALGPMRFASGSADAKGNMQIAGLKAVASPDVVAGDAWVTHSDWIETRESSPIRLSIGDVSSLSLEIGITSFATCTAGLVPGGVVRIPAYAPADDPGVLSSGKSSK